MFKKGGIHMQSLCNNWEFAPQWSDEFALGQGSCQPVRLPHTVRELPLHYIDTQSYQMLCGYRRKLTWEPTWENRRQFLQFDGAAHIATVYLNGRPLTTHRCGYTGFRVEITGLIAPGDSAWIAVRLDTTENPQIPPFGFVIDYLTYGGLYREVWLDLRESAMIDDIFVTTPTLTTASIRTGISGAKDCTCDVSILDQSGQILQTKAVPAGENVHLDCPNARPWSPDEPNLYTCRVTLRSGAQILDVQETEFGFRTAEFKADGFYLNGQKTFLRGLNRHQSFPYIGYAAPAHLQREDARILKEELGCNAVRTSHYPQSHHFLRECDRLGLIVFTELPGWQHIGDDAWKDQAVENVREMVAQYRNHPSIVLWGVRINESIDDDAFYRRTNAAAHQLDPSRPTSGVRHLTQSSLLEDVYSYNDFSHTGDNPGVKPKRSVTPDNRKALLISEHNGHMFPTKSYDTWQRRQEHALRHARVLNDAMADGAHAGCFGWCMFDYATHKDFGSGDRICYHGVMDSFRNPKLAAAVYASQQEQTPVLVVGSPMEIGDYPAGNIGTVSVFTNAQRVALYKNGQFVRDLAPGAFPALPHGPMVLDDTVGELLRTQEGFPARKAAILKKVLLSAGKVGLAALPLWDRMRMLWCMLRYGMTMADGVALYNRYIGNWGDESTVWRFDAMDGQDVIASVTCCPATRLHLEITPSQTRLHEDATYDMAAVRIRILDEHGNPAPYAQLPITFTLSGPAQLVGPEVVTAEGGMTGTYLRTIGQTGTAQLTISAPDLPPVTLNFQIS